MKEENTLKNIIELKACILFILESKKIACHRSKIFMSLRVEALINTIYLFLFSIS